MATTRPGSKRLIREINEALVLDALRVHGSIARSEIAARTGLSPATITGITARLGKLGLLTEVSQGQSTGGRPPKILALDRHGSRVVGVWLTRGRIVAVTVNLVGEIIDTCSLAWRGKSPESAIRSIQKAVRILIERSSQPVIGVGLTLSGMIDQESGVLRHSGLLGWEDVALSQPLASALGLPVTVDKLVNALGSAFVLFGEHGGVRDQLVVSIGHSIGLGMVLGGRVRHGVAGPAGSLGHTSVSVVDRGGKRCHCGSRGCLETVASEGALLAEFAQQGIASLDEASMRAADDKRVQATFERAGRALAGAVGNAAKIINPERIILCGEGTRLGAPLLEPFSKELHRVLADTAEHDIALEIVDTDAPAWARGAACQALTLLFQVGDGR